MKGKLYDLISEIKYAFQRAKKGYCDRDIWEIDTWFFGIMPKMLDELKANSEKIGNIPEQFEDEAYRRMHPEKSDEEIKLDLMLCKLSDEEAKSMLSGWLGTLSQMSKMFSAGDDKVLELFAKYLHCLSW